VKNIYKVHFGIAQKAIKLTSVFSQWFPPFGKVKMSFMNFTWWSNAYHMKKVTMNVKIFVMNAAKCKKVIFWLPYKIQYHDKHTTLVLPKSNRSKKMAKLYGQWDCNRTTKNKKLWINNHKSISGNSWAKIITFYQKSSDQIKVKSMFSPWNVHSDITVFWTHIIISQVYQQAHASNLVYSPGYVGSSSKCLTKIWGLTSIFNLIKSLTKVRK
jgi:hypothetical protein